MKKFTLIILFCFICSIGWCGVEHDDTDDGISAGDILQIAGHFTISVWHQTNEENPNAQMMVLKNATGSKHNYWFMLKDSGKIETGWYSTSWRVS